MKNKIITKITVIVCSLLIMSLIFIYQMIFVNDSNYDVMRYIGTIVYPIIIFVFAYITLNCVKKKLESNVCIKLIIVSMLVYLIPFAFADMPISLFGFLGRIDLFFAALAAFGIYIHNRCTKYSSPNNEQ